MAISDDRCLKIITEASQGKISRDEAENMLEKVQSRIDANLKRGMGEPSAIDKAVKESLTEGAIERTRARLRSIEDAQKKILNENRAINATNEIVNVRGGKEDEVKASDMYDAIRSILVGTNRIFGSSRKNLEAAMHSTFSRWGAGLNTELGNSGLMKFAQKGTYDEDAWREMAELNSREKAQPGITKNPYAEGLAKIFNNYVSLAKNNMNAAGANIKDLFGYVIEQTHGWEKIQKAGNADWKADILKWFGNKSFEGMDKVQLNTYLNGLHNAFVSGEHLGPVGSGEGMNIARIAGEQRHLIPNDAASAYQYFKKYGTDNTILEAVQRTLERSAKNSELMKTFTTNPEVGYQTLISDMKQHFSQIAPEAVREFKEKYEGPLQNRWKELNGTMDMPKNQLAKNIGVGFRTFENIVHLGNVLFAHTSMPVTRVAAMRQVGEGVWNSLGRTLADFLPNNAADKDLLQTLGAVNDGIISAHLDMFGQGFTGKAAAINNNYMKATLLPWAVNKMRIGAQRGLSNMIGRNLGKAFEEIHPEKADFLNTHGIGKDEWEMLRKVAPTFEGHLTPDMGDRLDDASVKSILQRDKTISNRTSAGGVEDAIKKYKNDFTNNLSAMFADESRRALNLPGAETRAILYQGTKSGSFQGEMMRALTTFKQWPTELMVNTLGREIYSNKTTGSKMLSIPILAAALTLSGYIRMSLRNLTAGYAPPSPIGEHGGKTILQSMQEGGAGMVFGDMLAGMMNQAGYAYTPGEKVAKGFISLLGPQAGTIESIGEYGAKAYAGKNPGKQLEDFAIHNIPAQNLFYIKLLTNYAFLWSLHDMIHPGWSQRYENSIARETGNKPFVGPVKK